MSCADWEDRIAEQTGGEFSASVGEHLRVCQDCAALAGGLEGDRMTLAAAPSVAIDAPDYAAMRRNLRAAIVRERRVRRYVPALLAAAAAVCAWVLARPPAPLPVRAPAPVIARAWAKESIAGQSTAVRTARVTKPKRIRRAAIPKVDLALLRKVTGVDAPAETGSESPVEMRIATGNPNVTIILLQAKEGSYE